MGAPIGNRNSVGRKKTGLIDLTGRKFSRLTVISRAPGDWSKPRWLCRCDCGVTKIIEGTSLKSGRQKSCGCLARERGKWLGKTYGGKRPVKVLIDAAWWKSYRETNAEKFKRWKRDSQKRLAGELSDSYVRRVITCHYRIPRNAVTEEMVQAKRAHLRLLRILKERSL